MDNDKMPTVEEEFLDALDVLWRQHGNEDPGYKAMLPFVKQIAELQAEVKRLRAEVERLRCELDDAAVALIAACQGLAEFEGFERAQHEAFNRAEAACRKAIDGIKGDSNG